MEITIDTSELEGFLTALQRFPEKVEGTLVAAMEESEDLVREALIEYPPEIPFPPSMVGWDSQKQRKAFHATKGFGGGDPHQRRGALESSYKPAPIQVSPEIIRGGVFSDQEWVKHVQGDPNNGFAQSLIHEGRWKTIKTIAETIRPHVLEVFKKYINKLAI